MVSEDVSSLECVQQAEVLAAEANRTLAQARSAVASAKQNRSGIFPSTNVPSSRKGKGKGKLKGKSRVHRVSSVAEVVISGDCPERQSKGSSKRGTNGSRTLS